MAKEQLSLLMGCFGRQDEDFVSCVGIQNPILYVEAHLHHYNEMMDYFDTCNLFDQAIFDYNTIRHFLFNLRDKFEQPTHRLWSEKKFTLYQKFTLDHKHCGLYLKLALLDLEKRMESPEKTILVMARNSQSESAPNTLLPIRGRRNYP